MADPDVGEWSRLIKIDDAEGDEDAADSPPHKTRKRPRAVWLALAGLVGLAAALLGFASIQGFNPFKSRLAAGHNKNADVTVVERDDGYPAQATADGEAHTEASADSRSGEPVEPVNLTETHGGQPSVSSVETPSLVPAPKPAPADAAGHHQLGVALKGQGKLDEAIREYQEAIRLKPDFAAAQSDLGVALAEQGKFEPAIAAQREAIRLQPDDANYHHRLGYVLQKSGSLARAISEYREAIRLGPDLSVAHNNLAWLLVLPPKRPRAEYIEGLQHARRATELKQDQFTFNTLALAEYRMEHWSESVAASRKAIAFQNGGSDYDWFLLALATATEGREGRGPPVARQGGRIDQGD